MKKGAFILITLLYATTLLGQHYPFYNLGVEAGLIQSQVRCLTQDKYGHLWVGTVGGLSRYDGAGFTNYNVRSGMLHNEVQTMNTDKNGNLWIGTTTGVSVFNGHSFKHYRLETYEGNSTTAVKEICIAKDNSVWCHTDSSVYKIVNGNITQLQLPQSSIFITAIASIQDTLWVATAKGVVYRHYTNKWDSLFYHIPNYDKPPIFTTEILKTKAAGLLFSTGTGLFRLTNDSLKVVTTQEGPLYNIPFTGITQNNDGSIWLGSTSGAYRLKDSTLVHFNKSNGFTDNTITSILGDKEGSVWLGSEGQGVYRFSGDQFSILDERSNLPSEQVMSFAATPNGTLYIGTADAGLYYYDGKKIYKTALRRSVSYISALLANSEYDIWVGTNRSGLYHIRGGVPQYCAIPDMPNNVLILSLYKDNTDQIWIGTHRGVAVYKDNKFEVIKGINNSVFSFSQIGTDSILMATDKGLILYTDSTLHKYATDAIPANIHPQCMTVCYGKVWLGTSDNGMICYDMQTHQSFTLNKDNGLQSDFIYNIIADKNNDIWLGTGFGIHKIQLQDEQPIVSFYGKGQGVTGMESNQNANCIMPDGTLWFGTTKGAVHIDPNKKTVLPQPISIVLQSVKLFGDNIRDSSYYDSTESWYGVPYKLTLPPKENNISFTFKGITLNGSEGLLYRYKLEGLDAPWSDWTSLNAVTYSALPSGNYTLHVSCKTINGTQVQSMTYPFSIITPFHKTKWFSFLILGACLLAGITIQYIINKRKQNRLVLVEKLRREERGKVQQRTAEDFHDEVGNRLTRINVLTNVLTAKMGNVSYDQQHIINQIQENTAELYNGTRDILWSLQPANDNLHEILYRIRNFGNDLFADTAIDFRFSGDDRKWHQYKLPLDMSRNLIMIFKEALNNCLKYADANDVHLKINLKDHDILHMTLTDNGKGFNIEEVVKGNGINNMRNRAKRMNGKLYIDTKQNKGTVINLHFKLPRKTEQA